MSIQSMEYNQALTYLHRWLFHFFYICIFISRYQISAIYHTVSPSFFRPLSPSFFSSFSLFSEFTFIACEKTTHFSLTRSDFDFVPASMNYRTVKEILFYIIIVLAYIFLFFILHFATASRIFPSLHTVPLSLDVSADAASPDFSIVESWNLECERRQVDVTSRDEK